MHRSNMACNGSSEKDISGALEKLFITPSDQALSQNKKQ